MASPAQLIKQYLIDQAIGVDPESDVDSDWPIFSNALPDGEFVKDNALCVLDTFGTLDGRIQSTGESIEHPGIQVYLRSMTESVGYDKIKAIADLLVQLRIVGVTVDATYRTIGAFRRTGSIIKLGQNVEDPKRRFIFTMNGMVTLL